MRAGIDDKIELYDVHMDVGSWNRKHLDRSAAGMDGIVSIDLGQRGRGLVVTGVIRGDVSGNTAGQLELLEGMVDGSEHELCLPGGVSYGHLRLDGVKVIGRRVGGVGHEAEVEIGFTQLRGE